MERDKDGKPIIPEDEFETDEEARDRIRRHGPTGNETETPAEQQIRWRKYGPREDEYEIDDDTAQEESDDEFEIDEPSNPARTQAILNLIGVAFITLIVAIFIISNWKTDKDRYRGWRALRTEIEAKGPAYLKPTENAMLQQCLSRIDMNWSTFADLLTNGLLDDRIKSLFHNPNCVGYVQYTFTKTCNAQLEGRRRACALYKGSEFEIEIAILVSTFEHDKGVKWDNELLNGIGKRLIVALKPTCYKGDIKFGVYHNNDFDAFAVPGRVIVSDSILTFSESEIAAIVAHEIAHIEWASYDDSLFDERVSTGKGAWLTKLKDKRDLILSQCRGPMDEIFVDKKAVSIAESAGYDPTGLRHAFERLQKSDPDTRSAYLMSDSHPPTDMRIRIADQTALEVLKLHRANTFWYYRGSDNTDEHSSPWNGKPPGDAFMLECTREATDCGNPEHPPKSGSVPDWSDYRCMKPDEATKRTCVSSDKYARALHGCPNTKETCCAP